MVSRGGSLMADPTPSFLRNFSAWLHRLGTTVLLPIMIVIITLDVVLRYFFRAPLIWSQDANGLLLLMVFWASFTYTWDEGRQLTMDIFYRNFRGRWKACADILANGMGMLFSGVLGIKTVMGIPNMIRLNETGAMLPIPLWPFATFMAFCSVLLFLRLAISTPPHVRTLVLGERSA
jgi:TRAP-type C4-dicarboxylate transport system permease small subunit